jgi:hypothetical protein
MDYDKEAKAILTAYNKYRKALRYGDDGGPSQPYTVLEAQVLAAVMSAASERGIDRFCYDGTDEYRENFITAYYGDIVLRCDMSTVYRGQTDGDEPHLVDFDYLPDGEKDYVMVAQLSVCHGGVVKPHGDGWQLIKLAIPTKNRRK